MKGWAQTFFGNGMGPKILGFDEVIFNKVSDSHVKLEWFFLEKSYDKVKLFRNYLTWLKYTVFKANK